MTHELTVDSLNPDTCIEVPDFGTSKPISGYNMSQAMSEGLSEGTRE